MVAAKSNAGIGNMPAGVKIMEATASERIIVPRIDSLQSRGYIIYLATSTKFNSTPRCPQQAAARKMVYIASGYLLLTHHFRPSPQ
jgi:hypothetical protein